MGEVNARRAWRAALATATATAGGRHVYAFGPGHLRSLVTEMNRRAGSLKVVRPVWNPELISQEDGEATGRLESTAGYAATLTADLDWGPGDLCWVISNSGRNVLVVEFAQEAKRRILGHRHYLRRALRLGTAGPRPAEAAGDRRLRPRQCPAGWAMHRSTFPGWPKRWRRPNDHRRRTHQRRLGRRAEKLVAAGHVPEVWGQRKSSSVHPRR